MINDFPANVRDIYSAEDSNPAVQLFGRRFFADQQVMDILGEFLLVISASKKIGEEPIFDDIFPAYERLQKWPAEESLNYYPQEKLNLKLFSFLGSSRLETRHETHRKHCKELWDLLKDKINSDDNEKKEAALALLSNLFLGFWGTGAQRTWCAQSFLPFCEGVLAGESIWKESKSKGVESWQGALSLFLFTQRLIYSRGGEMLYLQLCNALRQDADKISAWIQASNRQDCFTAEESDPQRLHAGLLDAFAKFFKRTPKTLNELADFIDRGVERETAAVSDKDGTRKVECGWCAEESWHEGYLFAVELLRLLRSKIDIMETVDLLQIACAMQLMRSLAAQSYRHSPNFPHQADGLTYRLLISDPDGENRRLKEFSHTCLTNVCREIYDAVRIPEIRQTIESENQTKAYNEADNRYGHKLYRKIGKSIGLIIPRSGNGSRFVLNDKILRYLVLALIPGERMTLDSFKKQIEHFHGFVFEEKNLLTSPNWCNKIWQLDSNTSVSPHLEQMLDASGALVKLSDSCSLVRNTFSAEAR